MDWEAQSPMKKLKNNNLDTCEVKEEYLRKQQGSPVLKSREIPNTDPTDSSLLVTTNRRKARGKRIAAKFEGETEPSQTKSPARQLLISNLFKEKDPGTSK